VAKLEARRPRRAGDRGTEIRRRMKRLGVQGGNCVWALLCFALLCFGSNVPTTSVAGHDLLRGLACGGDGVRGVSAPGRKLETLGEVLTVFLPIPDRRLTSLSRGPVERRRPQVLHPLAWGSLVGTDHRNQLEVIGPPLKGLAPNQARWCSNRVSRQLGYRAQAPAPRPPTRGPPPVEANPCRHPCHDALCGDEWTCAEYLVRSCLARPRMRGHSVDPTMPGHSIGPPPPA
jgi:hypothetical protein